MSAKLTDIAARDIENVLHPLTDLAAVRENGPLVIDRGSGIHVYDEAGREYIDGFAGLWCTALGFSEPALVRAAQEQLERLPFYHGFLGRSTRPVVELAARLKEIAPSDVSKVFFVNSGSEANDTQIKLIWHYNNLIGRPRKKKIISRRNAYHGSTIGAGSLTGLPVFHQNFDLPIPNVLHTDCPNYYRNAEPGESEESFSDRLVASLEAMIEREGPETIAAFIAEPVMAAGGVLLPPRTYFDKVQAVLRRHEIVFVADEVVCGFGRTGNMFGCETFGIVPDTISVAKQLSSAYMPIAAVMIPDFMYQAFVENSRETGTFGHGMTFGGHPVPAAVALRTLELFEERAVLGHVRSVAPYFQQRLERLGEHPLVGDARGVGLMGAVELVADKASRRPFPPELALGKHCMAACQQAGLLVRASGDVIALCPPLIVSEEELGVLFDRLEGGLEVTAAFAARQAA